MILSESAKSEDQRTEEAHRRSALVVVDVQNAVVAAPVHEPARLLATIAELLERARERGVPVVYVRHDSAPDADDLSAGSEGWQIHPAVAPRADETIVEKRWGDAFAATDMDEQLRRLGVGHLYLTGCETDACVRSTHVGALAHGYDVTLITDAHSLGTDRPGPTLDAEQIIAYHNETAPYLAYPGAETRVATSAQVDFAAEPAMVGT